tara:strand:- start:37 stop:441 length:405 start_codon:yes stop_codon:yes gene_type:complete
MIDSKIIKLASFTNNSGLRNKFTHKSSVKNSLCGDYIKTEFIAKNSKIKSMRYETDACLLCEASASLFARKVKDANIQNLIKEIKILKKNKDNSKYMFSKKFKDFNQLINKKNINRFNCVILPMDAFLKAFKIR